MTLSIYPTGRLFCVTGFVESVDGVDLFSVFPIPGRETICIEVIRICIICCCYLFVLELAQFHCSCVFCQRLKLLTDVLI